MDWEECGKKKIIKHVMPDENLSQSLVDGSRKKRLSAERLPIDEITAGSVIILLYDSARELLEALVIREGYKVYNHECYVAFLTHINERKLAQSFDRLRKIRNGINYYGKDLLPQEAEDIAQDIRAFIHRVSALLK